MARIERGVEAFNGGFKSSFSVYSVSRKGRLSRVRRLNAGEVTFVGDEPTQMVVDYDEFPLVVIHDADWRSQPVCVGMSQEAHRRLKRAGVDPFYREDIHDLLRQSWERSRNETCFA